ncbi:LacI family DNA-binding transcriptional regulator [Actinomadura barringtoniae]|uniref:LacI family DNA-binding transcriptional regulator n=1 Tax=Actinomadura barringtoniae TaxID=1427535 RepID=A0A939PGC8_9ACTN|nr:LacI family DNA-binding transcriptional regulator [Actinomadura barringtoniae]MBO2448699.1 LacI family DNA-binding transcriptional regulator [Actinomadura barringtoniae]
MDLGTVERDNRRGAGQMAARQHRVTSVDVAREAGVSRATVSYVLNKVPNQKISEETRLKVLAAVERLGYTPSSAARDLRRGRNDIVLLLLKDMPLGFTALELVEQLTDSLGRHELTLVTRLERKRPLAELWRELTPAAVVFFTNVAEDDRAQLSTAGTHIVHHWSDAADRNSINSGQTDVGRLQADHLARAGHRTLGYLLPDDPRFHDFYDLRLEGVRQGCAAHGLKAPDVRTMPFGSTAAVNIARAWKAAGVTGVCAFNDEFAFSLLAGMRTAGLTAPDDLAVVGVDDIPLAQFAVPPLTTVRQDMRIVADNLTHQVLKGLGLAVGGGTRTSSITLVVRDSA